MIDTIAQRWYLFLCGFVFACGCTSPATSTPFTHLNLSSSQILKDGRRIARNPVAFLRDTLEKCEAVLAYEADFYKQERLGLWIKDLRPEEHMRVRFRADPFSVKMEMLDDWHDFVETVYVSGQNRNLMRCRWRRSLLPGSTPPVNDYAPAFAVRFGKSLHPITEFGIARLMHRVFAALEQAQAMKLPPAIEYLGVTSLEKGDVPVHHLQLRYIPQTTFVHRKVDLLFHVDSLLPAGCYLWLAGDRLNAKYVYAKIDLYPRFSDEDFQVFSASGDTAPP